MKRDLFSDFSYQTALIETLSLYSDKSKETQYVCQALAFSVVEAVALALPQQFLQNFYRVYFL